jgi:hypothetical protein
MQTAAGASSKSKPRPDHPIRHHHILVPVLRRDLPDHREEQGILFARQLLDRFPFYNVPINEISLDVHIVEQSQE